MIKDHLTRGEFYGICRISFSLFLPGGLHKDKVRLALGGDGLGQKCLAAAQKATEQNALRRVHAKPLELERVLDGELHEILLDSVEATDGGPRDARDLDVCLAQRYRVAERLVLAEVLLRDPEDCERLGVNVFLEVEAICSRCHTHCISQAFPKRGNLGKKVVIL